MFEDFKKDMTEEFEMTDIRFMSYYVSIEVKQEDHVILITHEGYANEVLKKFKMDDTNPVSTSIKYGINMLKQKEREIEDQSLFRILVGSLQYLTCTRPDILSAIGVVSRYMEHPTINHSLLHHRYTKLRPVLLYF